MQLKSVKDVQYGEVNTVQQVQFGSPMIIPKVMTQPSIAVLNSSHRLQRQNALLR